MTDEPGATSRRRRNSDRARMVLVGIVVAALAVAALSFVSGQWGIGCSTTDEYALAVAPALAPAVGEALARADTGCAAFEITAEEPGDVASRLGTGAGAPDLWIPEGGWWARRAQDNAAGSVRTISFPLATSPLVLAGAPDAVPVAPNWRSALGLAGLDLGNPLRTGTAAGVIRAALAETADNPVAVGTVRSALAVHAQREGARREEPPTGQAALERIEGDDVIVTTEQQVQVHRRTRERDLDVWIPENGTVMVDYPIVVTAPDPDRNARAARTGAALADALHAADARAILSREGFRDGVGHALPDIRGLGTVPVLELQDDAIMSDAMRTWTLLALPVRTLIVVDVSESMRRPVDGTTPLELVAQAAQAADDVFPDSVSAGLWMFASDIGVPGRDYVEIAPVRRFDTMIGSETQREIVTSLDKWVPDSTGTGTALYDTVLEAFRTAQAGYDPRAVNSVIVVTDGGNDDPGGIGKDELLAALGRLRDPARPVPVLTVGVTDTADGDVLAEIATATGGSSYLAGDPSELAQILVSALADRSRR